MVQHDLIENELPKYLFVESVLLKLEVEILNRQPGWLVSRLMDGSKEGVRKGLCSAKSMIGVVAKQLLH